MFYAPFVSLRQTMDLCNSVEDCVIDGTSRGIFVFVRWSTFVYIPQRKVLEGVAVKFEDLEDDGHLLNRFHNDLQRPLAHKRYLLPSPKLFQ